jgi:NADH dehydrogenase
VETRDSEGPRRPHVVIVGAGFGGLAAAKALRRAPVRVTVIDRNNHHLFQPLLYQVAMAGLSPADIAAPIRHVLGRQRNAEVLLGEVTDVDLAARRVVVRDEVERTIGYDYLVLATGAQTNWFGRDEWAENALGLKDLDDAVEVRRRVLLAFEAAEREPDPDRRRRLLTFAVIGGGPTGVELAGALAELCRHVLARDFRRVGPQDARVVLIEGGPRLLAMLPESLSRRADRDLRRLGVEVRTGAAVTDIDANGLAIGDERLPAGTAIWAAGVTPTPLGRRLGVPLDRTGRVVVGADGALPGHPEVFALGDMAALVQDGRPLPGVAPAALQQGRSAARNIRADLVGRMRRPFRYVDKGTMASVGRSSAVAAIGPLRLGGRLAWLLWSGVHVAFLAGFRSRLMVLANWGWSYLTYERGARLILGGRRSPGPTRAAAREPRPWSTAA